MKHLASTSGPGCSATRSRCGGELDEALLEHDTAEEDYDEGDAEPAAFSTEPSAPP